MSLGITKTIPQSEGAQAVNDLYEVDGEYEFHMAGKPSRLKVGDYVYTIFQDELMGRCQIVRLEGGAVNPKSGKPRTLIYVRTPGERLPVPIPRKGHRGTRYYDGADWPQSRQPDWVAEHLRRYLETDGEDGHFRNGVSNLLLTTTGRRTGQPRTTPLIYGVTGDDYVIVASRGGADYHPSWYLNLVENPAVQLQVGAERFAATARTATSEEKPTLWKLMADILPSYNDFQAKTERDIPVVVLERV